MSSSYNSLANADRCRGSSRFGVQTLRAPLTINNIIAMTLTLHVRSRQYEMNHEVSFDLLAILFAMSIGYNMLSMTWFFHISRKDLDGNRCSYCDSRKNQGLITLDEGEKEFRMEKYSEMNRRMPSLFIAATDLLMAGAFLGLFIATTVIAGNWYHVDLELAYSTIGALVAFVFNFIIGVSGVGFWLRQHTKKQDVKLKSIASDEYLDVTENLLPADANADAATAATTNE